MGRFHAGVVFGQWYWPPPERPTGGSYWLNSDGEWEQFYSWETPDVLLVDGTENGETWEYTLGVEQQVGAASTFSVMGVYKKTKDLIGWYIVDVGEYETFIYTDPWTHQEFVLRDYGGEGPTRMKGNSSGPGANGGDRPYEQEYRAGVHLQEAVQRQLGHARILHLLQVRGPEPDLPGLGQPGLCDVRVFGRD